MRKLFAIIFCCWTLVAFGETVTTEKPVSGSRPEYPLEARKARVIGSGVYMLRVNERGFVVKVEIAKHSGSKLLDDAAVKTFSHWRFRPGKPLRWVRTPVSWSLPGSMR